MSTHEQAPQPEIQAEASRAELIEQALALSEIAGPAGEQDEYVKSVLLANAEKVKTEYTYSGGFTIPGTDEWIPGKKTPSYTLEITDEGGKVTSERLPSSIAERLLNYKAAHAEVKPAEPTQEKTDTPVKPSLPKQAKLLSKPKVKKSEAAEVVPVKTTHPAKQHRRAMRPQGPATPINSEVQNGTKQKGVAQVSREVKAAADLVGLNARNRGRGTRGRFLSTHELELIAEHQDLIRSGIGKNVAKSPEPTAVEPLITSARPISTAQSIKVTSLVNNTEVAAEPVATTEQMPPIEEATPEAMRARREGFMARTARLLREMPAKTANSLIGFYNDEERGRRRTKITAVVGLVAVAGYAALELKGYLPSRQHAGGNASQDALGTFNTPPKASPEAVKHVETLLKGHTIWGDVDKLAAAHNHTLSGPQTKGFVDQILQHNHITYEQARHLPTGFHWDIPPQVYDALTKKS